MPTFNTPANGFHLYTVSTDGYGALISEGEDGKEIARVDTTAYELFDPTPYLELTRKTFFKLNAEEL